MAEDESLDLSMSVSCLFPKAARLRSSSETLVLSGLRAGKHVRLRRETLDCTSGIRLARSDGSAEPGVPEPNEELVSAGLPLRTGQAGLLGIPGTQGDVT